MGIEPTSSAWKAEVLPLNYTRLHWLSNQAQIVVCPFPHGGGGWIRTTEAYASDLQSDPFGHSGTPPKRGARFCLRGSLMSNEFSPKNGF